MHILTWSISALLLITYADSAETGRRLIKVVKVRAKDRSEDDTARSLSLEPQDSGSKFGDRVGPKTRQLDLTSFKSFQILTATTTSTASNTPSATTWRGSKAVTAATTSIPVSSKSAPVITTQLPLTKTIFSIEAPVTSKKPRRKSKKGTSTSAPTVSSTRKRKTKAKTTAPIADSPIPSTTFAFETVSRGIVGELTTSEELELENLDFAARAGELGTPATTPISLFTQFEEVFVEPVTPPVPLTVKTTIPPSKLTTLPKILSQSDDGDNIALFINADILKEGRKITTTTQSQPRLSNKVFVFERPPPDFTASEDDTFTSQQNDGDDTILPFDSDNTLPSFNEGLREFTEIHPVSEPTIYKERPTTTVRSIQRIQTTSVPPTTTYQQNRVTTYQQNRVTTYQQNRVTTYQQNSDAELSDDLNRRVNVSSTSSQGLPISLAPTPHPTTASSAIYSTKSSTRTTTAKSKVLVGVGSKADAMPIDLLALAAKFSCIDREEGYYADIETDCQAWHWCTPGDRKFTFTCPAGTRFNQVHQVCDWRSNVDCSKAEAIYISSNKRDDS